MIPEKPEAPARTEAYFQALERRRDSLRQQLARILPTSGTFTWELGCGHGHFLTAFAAANPGKLCIGIDIVSDRIQRAERKRDRAKLENLHFLHAEARLFLESIPRSVSFSELFILFPDPWPKARHHKHRILQPAFLTAAAQCADAGSRLCFRTDFGPYFAAARDAIHQHPYWTLSAERWPFEYDTVFQTRAESYQSLVARKASGPV